MVSAHTLTVSRTAHYYSIGQPHSHVNDVWVCCHGYGQSAQRFLYRFIDLQAKNRLLIAPEGLSRFYWDGFSGEVVASWMTKADRQDEIADYAAYLQQLLDEKRAAVAPNAHVTLFGFSQGVQTIMRWITRQSPTFNRLILWAGAIPDDIDFTRYNHLFEGKEIWYVYGKNDRFVSAETEEKMKRLLDNSGFTYRVLTFEGKHEVDKMALGQLTSLLSTHER